MSPVIESCQGPLRPIGILLFVAVLFPATQLIADEIIKKDGLVADSSKINKDVQDGPEDTVLLMAPFVVSANTIWHFTDIEIGTDIGKGLLISKRYPGAKVPVLNPMTDRVRNYGALMLRDDERLRKLTQFEDLIGNIDAVGEHAASGSLQVEIEKAFIRPDDWSTEALDKSINNYRR